MAVTSTATREIPASAPNANPPSAPASTNTRPSRSTNTGRPIPARASRTATDDEILGLDPAEVRNAALSREEARAVPPTRSHFAEGREQVADALADSVAAQTAEPEALRATLDANPDLRRAWDDAQAYRESFASPDDARNATALLADLDRMDALFFSRRPEDHAELARAVASLDPAAFASLAQAMNGLATESQSHRDNRPGNRGLPSAPLASPVIPRSEATRNLSSDAAREIPRPPWRTRDDSPQIGDSVSGAPAAPTIAQTEFFHATNAAAVQSVIEAIESQVERLLPEGVSKSARNRVVGEIYRELDTTLQSNRQLAQQMREAFRSGALDADHQRALVSLVTGRARQALPGVAKRVLNEWTSTIVAANQDRRTRQRAAEHRVDIAGSGGGASDGQRSMSPRDIDYRRMSDADILNL